MLGSSIFLCCYLHFGWTTVHLLTLVRALTWIRTRNNWMSSTAWMPFFFLLPLIFLEKVRNLSPCLTSLRQVVACRRQRIETSQAGIMLYIFYRLAAMQHRSVLNSRGQRVPYSGCKCHQEPGEGLTITSKKRTGVKAKQTGESEKVDTR